MQTSKLGKAEIAHSEGVSLTKYLDSVGVHTIGIGATVSEIPDIKQWAWEKALTLEQVFDLFSQSLVKYENAVNKAVKVPLEQHQFDALVSICYNIGTGGLSKSTFVKRINSGSPIGSLPRSLLPEQPYEWFLDRTDTSVIQEEDVILSARGGGSVVEAIMFWTKPKEITGRRRKEAKLFSTGVYSGDGTTMLFPVSTKSRLPLYAKGKRINALQYL